VLHRPRQLDDEQDHGPAGYLFWSKRVPTTSNAIALVERLFKRSIGPDGRSVLFDLPELSA
jgi:hypothetical protein